MNAIKDDIVPEEEGISLERRMGHLERSLAVQGTLLQRNTEILDDIRAHINRPTNWPAWISSGLGFLVVFGGLMYAAYIKPIETKVEHIQSTLDFRQRYIDSHEQRIERLEKRGNN